MKAALHKAIVAGDEMAAQLSNVVTVGEVFTAEHEKRLRTAVNNFRAEMQALRKQFTDEQV